MSNQSPDYIPGSTFGHVDAITESPSFNGSFEPMMHAGQPTQRDPLQRPEGLPYDARRGDYSVAVPVSPGQVVSGDCFLTGWQITTSEACWVRIVDVATGYPVGIGYIPSNGNFASTGPTNGIKCANGLAILCTSDVAGTTAASVTVYGTLWLAPMD